MRDRDQLDQRQPLLDQVGLLGARRNRAGDADELRRRRVEPTDVGLGAADPQRLAERGDVEQVAQVRRVPLAGERRPGNAFVMP